MPSKGFYIEAKTCVRQDAGCGIVGIPATVPLSQASGRIPDELAW